MPQFVIWVRCVTPCSAGLQGELEGGVRGVHLDELLRADREQVDVVHRLVRTDRRDACLCLVPEHPKSKMRAQLIEFRDPWTMLTPGLSQSDTAPKYWMARGAGQAMRSIGLRPSRIRQPPRSWHIGSGRSGAQGIFRLPDPRGRHVLCTMPAWVAGGFSPRGRGPSHWEGGPGVCRCCRFWV